MTQEIGVVPRNMVPPLALTGMTFGGRRLEIPYSMVIKRKAIMSRAG